MMKKPIETVNSAALELDRARRNQDLLKDTPETGEEGYTENMEATGCERCGCRNGITILPTKGGRRQ